jgi:demethylmenaquinone methyltransferase/2-methoxy-6-polyprenyl-1,4-benzoquinol methylase
MDTYAEKLRLADLLREPAIRAAIQALDLPPGSRGLDAGCGIGSHVMLLAEAVGPAGHVTGLDLQADFLSLAGEMAAGRGLSDRVDFRQGNLSRLPFDDDTFDWAWSSDCLGYPAGEGTSLLRELARVVKRGGTVAILGWSSQQLLPGYPLLEAHLNATCLAHEHILAAKPESHFMRALGWFRAAGFMEETAQTFAGTVQGPLDEDHRKAVLAFFDMLWPARKPGMTEENWATYQRLTQPDSPDYILACPDYCALFTYSVFSGRAGK